MYGISGQEEEGGGGVKGQVGDVATIEECIEEKKLYSKKEK